MSEFTTIPFNCNKNDIINMLEIFKLSSKDIDVLCSILLKERQFNVELFFNSTTNEIIIKKSNSYILINRTMVYLTEKIFLKEIDDFIINYINGNIIESKKYNKILNKYFILNCFIEKLWSEK